MSREPLQSQESVAETDESAILAEVNVAWLADRAGIWDRMRTAPNGRGSMSSEDTAELAYKMGYLKAKGL
jgi:hypothetical protein